MHGGKTPVGPASPNWIDGRYSRVLPLGLVEAYRRSQDDPARLELGAEIALVDARIGELLRGIDQGTEEDDATWRVIAELIDRRRKLVESERRRLVQAEQMISAEQALALLALLVEAVHEHVHDRHALRAIVDEYTRLTGTATPTRRKG